MQTVAYHIHSVTHRECGRNKQSISHSSGWAGIILSRSMNQHLTFTSSALTSPACVLLQAVGRSERCTRTRIKKHQNVELSLKSLPVSRIRTSVEETDQVANFAQDAALKNINLVSVTLLLFPFFLRITFLLQVDWILLHRGCFCSRNHSVFFWQISPSVSHRNSDKLFNRLQTAAALLMLISDQSANYFMYVLYNLKATSQTAASARLLQFAEDLLH